MRVVDIHLFLHLFILFGNLAIKKNCFAPYGNEHLHCLTNIKSSELLTYTLEAEEDSTKLLYLNLGHPLPIEK